MMYVVIDPPPLVFVSAWPSLDAPGGFGGDGLGLGVEGGWKGGGDDGDGGGGDGGGGRGDGGDGAGMRRAFPWAAVPTL